MEAFWARMQTELLNTKKWSITLELTIAMADYIDNFYNTQRRHSYLGNISPTEYEKLWQAIQMWLWLESQINLLCRGFHDARCGVTESAWTDEAVILGAGKVDSVAMCASGNSATWSLFSRAIGCLSKSTSQGHLLGQYAHPPLGLGRSRPRC